MGVISKSGDVFINKKNKHILEPLVETKIALEHMVDIVARNHHEATNRFFDTVKELYPELKGKIQSIDHPRNGKWKIILKDTTINKA